jgi:hypothetical protein
MKEAVHFVIVRAVFFCGCIVSRALPFAMISQRFWRPGSERSREWIAIEPRNGTASAAWKRKLQNCDSRNAVTRYTFTYTKLWRALYCIMHMLTKEIVQSVRSKIQMSYTSVSHYRVTAHPRLLILHSEIGILIFILYEACQVFVRNKNALLQEF